MRAQSHTASESEKPSTTELLSPEEHYYSTPSTNKSNKASHTLDFYDHIAKKDRPGSNAQANYAYISIRQLTGISKDGKINQRPNINSIENNNIRNANTKSFKDYQDIWSSAADTTADLYQPPVPSKSDVIQLDNGREEQAEHIDTTEAPPPKLTENSGILPQNPSKVLVRPIAFKPVLPTKRTGYSPERSSFTPISYDDGYSSRDTSRAASHSTSTMSRDSELYISPTQNQVYGEFQAVPAQTESMMLDSDVERLLQGKESEIARLRQTMELNESAIIRVQEQKRIEWENQMQELAQEYHRRLRMEQTKSQDRDLELRQIIAKLELDKRQLSVDIQQNQVDKDRQEQLASQVRELKQRNTDISQKLTEESCECELLRHRNKDLEQQAKTFEDKLSVGKIEQQKLSDKIIELESTPSGSEKTQNMRINQLNQQLQRQEQSMREEREKFRSEQEKWKEEKEKVLQYQKQLQRTYVQMYRRNNELEQQLCRINSRRHNRTESQGSANSNDKHSFFNIDLDTSPESFC